MSQYPIRTLQGALLLLVGLHVVVFSLRISNRMSTLSTRACFLGPSLSVRFFPTRLLKLESWKSALNFGEELGMFGIPISAVKTSRLNCQVIVLGVRSRSLLNERTPQVAFRVSSEDSRRFLLLWLTDFSLRRGVRNTLESHRCAFLLFCLDWSTDSIYFAIETHYFLFSLQKCFSTKGREDGFTHGKTVKVHQYHLHENDRRTQVS